MGNVLVNDAYLYGIADALREKHGTEKKYLPSEMEDAVRGIQSGGVDNMKFMTQWGSTFSKASFSEETHLVLEYGDTFGGVMSNMFSYTSSSKIKSIKIVGSIKIETAIMNNTFQNCSAELIDFSECDLGLSGSAMQKTFISCSKLKEIKGTLDVSRVTSFISVFDGCTVLEEVRFLEGNIFKSISLSNSPNLSDASIDSLVKGFANMTGQTSPVLTVHKDVKARIEANETWLSTLTSKNVTLA